MTQRVPLGQSVLTEDLDHEGEPAKAVGSRGWSIIDPPAPEPRADDSGPTCGSYKPMPGFGSPGFKGRVKLKNQVPVADWTFTEREVWESRRYRDLNRPCRPAPVTDEEREAAKANGLYTDLDAVAPESNPQSQYRQAPAKPAPVETPKRSFESVRARNQRQLDEMFKRHFGQTYRD